jgi:biopolymer transport protein ExbD
MAIRAPGRRNSGNNPARRDAIMVLNITAMVDMFTVLTVFLLQNYATTNQVLPLDETVNLPIAHETKELKPSNVVALSSDGLRLNNVKIAEFHAVKEQQDWLVKPLFDNLKQIIEEGRKKKGTLGNKIRDAVSQAKGGQPAKEDNDEFSKITVQADKTIDFLTVKKVMFSVTEAGAGEIIFAVFKKEGDISYSQSM